MVILAVGCGVLVPYLVVEVIINRVKHGKRGMEMLPHRDFWRSVYGLVADGIRFTVVKACGVGSGAQGAESYAPYDRL